MRSSRRPRQLFILFVDVGMFFLSLYFALFVRYASPPSFERWWDLSRSFLVSVAGLDRRLLHGRPLQHRQRLRRAALRGKAFRRGGGRRPGLCAHLLPRHLRNEPEDHPRAVHRLPVSSCSGCGGSAMAGSRACTFRAGQPRSSAWTPTVVEIVAAIESNDHLGYEAVAFLDETGRAPPGLPPRRVRSREAFVKVVKERGVSLVVVADEGRLSEKTRRALLDLIEQAGALHAASRLLRACICGRSPSGRSTTCGSWRTSTWGQRGDTGSSSGAFDIPRVSRPVRRSAWCPGLLIALGNQALQPRPGALPPGKAGPGRRSVSAS